MDCVVAIGAANKQGAADWIASGFLYGHLVSHHRVKEEEQRYLFALVTNRHVVENQTDLYLRFNPIGRRRAQQFRLPLVDEGGGQLWKGHPKNEVDIALVPVNLQLLRDKKIQFSSFLSNKAVANIKKMKEVGITEGDFTYILGFPMGIVGEKRNTVLVRSGTIARIRDALSKSNDEFLIDAQIFPGNSGGPVISKPEGMAIKGTKAQKAAYLIGIVKTYVPYEDVAVSVQTKRPRVIFSENSGLAAAHPIDFVQEVCKELVREARFK